MDRALDCGSNQTILEAFARDVPTNIGRRLPPAIRLVGSSDRAPRGLARGVSEVTRISQIDAARRLAISLNRLSEIVVGKRSITAAIALRLGRFL
jgi:hypothetical protein